jgi:hypothetical protein
MSKSVVVYKCKKCLCTFTNGRRKTHAKICATWQWQRFQNVANLRIGRYIDYANLSSSVANYVNIFPKRTDPSDSCAICGKDIRIPSDYNSIQRGGYIHYPYKPMYRRSDKGIVHLWYYRCVECANNGNYLDRCTLMNKFELCCYMALCLLKVCPRMPRDIRKMICLLINVMP